MVVNPSTSSPSPFSCSVELVMDDQCDITWVVPKGVEPTPLFQTSSFFMEKDTIDFIGEQYKVFTFSVEVRALKWP